MAQELLHQYAASESVSYGDVRSALRAIEDDDVSKNSPISEGASEVGLTVEEADGDHSALVTVRVEGHEGEWTKTSERALKSAVQSVEGVGELVEKSGGYDGGDK
jgi:hypothetical protein